MRTTRHFALAFVSLALTAASFVADLARDALHFIVHLAETAPTLLQLPKSAHGYVRRISLQATALNGRHVGGVQVHGFLGRPAVRMLVG